MPVEIQELASRIKMLLMDVDGVMTPFTMEMGAKGMPQRQKMSFSKIEMNVPIDDSRFAFTGKAAADTSKAGKADAKAEATLSTRVKQGNQGVWGGIPMPAHPNVSDEDIRSLVRWILAGAS